MEEVDCQNFFNNFQEFKAIQKKQKQRGLNDFNILTTVLKYSDEVRLHSRMIGNLLNPNAKHYQDTLFLEQFLKMIGLDNWGLDLLSTTVSIEYKDIDLYITDGDKHIIIENKIWAEDQPCQIMKYINIIVEENKDSIDLTRIVGENIILDENVMQVIYLTPRAKEVSSAHKKDNDGYIYFDGEENADDELSKCSKRNNTEILVPDGLKKYKAKYKKITYRKHIIRWLQNSQNEVRNITNLNEVIQQYIDVVERVNGNYKGKVMGLKEYVKDNNMELETLFSVRKEIEELQRDLLYEFFSKEINGVVKVNDDMKRVKNDYKYYIYNKDTCRQWFLGTAKDFGSFYKINDEYLLYVAIGKKNIHYGIVKHENYAVIDALEGDKSYGLEYRGKGWRNIKWFSEGLSLDKNLNILNDYDESVLKDKINDLIKQFKQE
ncbi:MAG: hypothetical protein GQ531_10490 [Sulfurovum sp.]|nr:hypothetical protein [Sulfurovum sp.]